MKNSGRGWLGNTTPVEFLQTSEAEHRMPCHNAVDYERSDWEEQASKAPQCVGRAIHFANRCKLPRAPDLITAVADREAVFSNPQDFIDHHTLGQEIPVIAIFGSMVMVTGTKTATHKVAADIEQER